MPPVRTRFAPSPTGSLHVGGVRTALYCLLLARNSGGAFLLRIEDTDRARSTEQAARGIVRDLRWLGLQWDEGPDVGGPHGPYLQSQRLARYDAAVEALLAQGKAYLAWETPAELTAMRAEARAAKRDFVYRERVWSDAEIAGFHAEGRRPVVRLKAPGRRIVVNDRVLGEVALEPEKLEDFVIRKADGFPTYHLAVVIDDTHMQIDLVLRGQEHLMNTHKHHALYEALGLPPIPTAHLPLIDNPGGTKMGKRDKAKAARLAARQVRDAEGADALAHRTGLAPEVLQPFLKKKNDDIGTAETIATALGVDLPMIEVLDFQRAGFLPEALVNYLALLGWSPGDDREIMGLADCVAAFSIDRVTKTPARFDVDKLRWMNGEYLRKLAPDALASAIDSWLEVTDSALATASPQLRAALVALFGERIQTFGDLDRDAGFFFVRPTAWDPRAVKKHLEKGGGFDRLAELGALLGALPRWDAPGLEAALQAYCAERELGLGRVAQPLRVAISGAGVTPPIFDVLALLGQAECVARIDACLAAHGHSTA